MNPAIRCWHHKWKTAEMPRSIWCGAAMPKPTSPQLPGLTDEQVADMITKHSYARDPQGFQDSVVMTYWHAQQFARTAFAAGCEARRKMDEAESDELAAKCVELEQQVHDAYLLGKDEQRRVDAEIARQEREAAHLEHDRWDQGYRRACDNVARAIERTPEQPTTRRCPTCRSDNRSIRLAPVMSDRRICYDNDFHSQPTTGEAGK